MAQGESLQPMAPQKMNGRSFMVKNNTQISNSFIEQLIPKVMCAVCLCVYLVCCGCATKDHTTIDLMPAPDVYIDGVITPFSASLSDEKVESPLQKIFYATDRKPVDSKKSKDKYYGSERGYLLRLGVAKVTLGKNNMTWKEAREISLLKNRPGKFPLKVSNIEEYGILNDTLTMFDNPAVVPDDPVPANKFAEAINKKIATSSEKDIFIYVPGFKVIFENPILVASELWHFLGFDGVFIAYCWPSTTKNKNYFSDVETATYSARNFQIFLEYLAENTDAEQIHIIGYSAGTRLVLKTLDKLSLMNHGSSPEKIQKKLRIGHVFLLGSDVDRDLAAAYIVDGVLNVPRTLNIYQSSHDKALGMSRWVHQRERLGQANIAPLDRPLAMKYFRESDILRIINVTEAENSAAGNGHGYFRKSPWVSSDVLMTIMHDLTPIDRGLVRDDDSFIWTFPPNYIQHLQKALKK